MKFVRVETPLGDQWFSYTERGLYSLEFPPGGFQPGEGQTGSREEMEDPPWVESFTEALTAFLNGEEVDFTPFPVDYSGFSPFFVRVLEETRQIPYGGLSSYGFLAEAAGRPGAGRAVGNCMGKNRLPMVIPCHRVIKRDGTLGGYGSGLHWKKYLLKLEGTPIPRDS